MKFAKLNSLIPTFIALLAGALLPFAFAPYRWYPLAFCLPAVLFALSHNATPRKAAWLGWLFGVGFFSLGASWIYISIHQYGNANIPFALLLTGLFISILALYFSGLGWLLTRFFPMQHPITALLVFPSLWVLIEALRGWLFTGFPWLFLGYSQTNSPLQGFIPIVGVYGTSWICVWLSGLIYLLFKNKWRSKIWALLLIVSTLSAGWGISQIHWTKPIGKPFKVHLVQGNIAQEIKWSPKFLENTLRRYWQLTQAISNSDLIIWPENAVPAAKHSVTPLLDALDSRGKKHQTSILFGLPILDVKTNHYFNGITLVGWGKGDYYKRHLVPFGEYLPFEWLRGTLNFFDLPMSNFHAGPRRQKLLVTKNARIAAFICYEIAYAATLYHELPAAELLVTISDDSWFGRSWAQAQHLQIGQARALQVGRELLFSTNNGISAIIGARGNIKKQAPTFVTTVLAGQAQRYQGSTPWVWVGNFILGLFIFCALILIHVKLRRYQIRKG